MVHLFLLTALALLPCFSISSSELASMSVEEKVGQLLIVHFEGKEANESARRLIQNQYVGGFIYYNWANGLESPEQVSHLSCGLQKLALQNRISIPLLIAIDQEGGRVSRLQEGFTIFPSNETLGQTGKPELAASNAYAMGQEMAAVGINLNLAPVVDINSDPSNRVIGSRSYGSTAELVTTFGRQALIGFHKAGIMATLKHFPGHGDVLVDSHDTLPVLNKSKEVLKRVELYPFQQLAQETDIIMTAHLLVPTLDATHCATLSKTLIEGLLREEMGYQGVVMTDSLVMKGLLNNAASIEEAAIQAIEAGCDLLLLGGRQLSGKEVELELTEEDIQKIHKALVTAFKTGRISEKRLDQSVERILDLKNQNLNLL